eukprot:CAMPEP_0182493304 /NCGR_PEP_ID=MMETSP1321-20130603/2284_1 /TAXON_ID=91990 /ORGANISM="Bolidomonas sp., Strain RCC1657" /LENGTH=42 /DNA_ID= /DNA_START= /DNA_END= /DNA_ORIENTATION=
MGGDVNVVYGVGHVEGINDILEGRGWEVVGCETLNILRVEKE